MKYCVDVQARAERSLEDDNLRGERRWERHAARALLDVGRQVGSVRDAWAKPDTVLWTGPVRSLAGHVLITQADPSHVRYRRGASAFVTNVFSALDVSAGAEVRQAVTEMGRGRVALTHSFSTHVPPRTLSADFYDLIHWLPVPAVPRVRRDVDTFVNKTFLWAARSIHLRMINPLPSIIELLNWIRGCLQEDPGLQFEVLACESKMSQAEADRYVWGFSCFAAALLDVRRQVRVHPSLHWSEVQQIFARTKLMVNDPTAFGGPPLEAASFGIPVPGRAGDLFHTVSSSDAPPTTFPGHVRVGDAGGPSLVDVLDRWHRDGDAYRRAGEAYRKFVEENYTYAAFVRHLDALPVFQ